MTSEQPTGSEPELDEIRGNLWNGDVTPATYPGGAEKYGDALLEQYTLYVEMADRISSRRGLANTFFLTLNSAILTQVGVFWQEHPAELSTWALILLVAVALGQTAAWWVIVRSYRQLNDAKYKVVQLHAHFASVALNSFQTSSNTLASPMSLFEGL